MHSEDFLRKLADYRVMGDFAPFDSGKHGPVVNYIKSMVDRLRDMHHLRVEADFGHYGSGTASYAEIRISKKDGSDSHTYPDTHGLRTDTSGLVLYISYLVPYWYYGGMEWSVLRKDGKEIGGASGFLRPESIDSLAQSLWETDAKRIKNVMDGFRYRLLSREELETKLPFDIQIPTILGDEPYQVFDCFFYWED